MALLGNLALGRFAMFACAQAVNRADFAAPPLAKGSKSWLNVLPKAWMQDRLMRFGTKSSGFPRGLVTVTVSLPSSMSIRSAVIGLDCQSLLLMPVASLLAPHIVRF